MKLEISASEKQRVADIMQVSLFELVSHCYTARLYQVSSKTWFWGKFYWFLRLQYSCQNQFVAEKMVALIRIPTLQYCWSPRVLDVGKDHVLLISPQDYQVYFFENPGGEGFYIT